MFQLIFEKILFILLWINNPNFPCIIVHFQKIKILQYLSTFSLYYKIIRWISFYIYPSILYHKAISTM